VGGACNRSIADLSLSWARALSSLPTSLASSAFSAAFSPKVWRWGGYQTPESVARCIGPRDE
jgi:hypothetical protein